MSTQLISSDMKLAAFKLFKAAMAPDPLQNWARVIADVLQAEVASVTVFCSNLQAIANGTVSGDPQKWEAFRSHHQFCNPLRDYWQAAGHGDMVRMDQLFACSRLRSTGFYSTYAEDLDRGRGICMSLNVRSAKVLISASRPLDRKLETIDLGPLKALQDDIQLACEISGTRAQSSVLIRNMLGSFGQKDIGAALLGTSGEIEETNDLFGRILGRGEMLSSDGGRLALSADVLPCGFAEALRRAARANKSSRLQLRSRREEELGHLIIHPAHMVQDWEEPEPGKIIILVSEAARHAAVLHSHLAQHFGLTPVEARVAGMLQGGKTSRLIADELEVQPNTIRAHLKSIFAKTGTHSQVELLSFLRSDPRQI